ncbi:hypothetical protein LEP1GSC047_0537 [Leptospira inadai serovar Lyme str. 10]|uniref:Uncharacterized protein n=1 Tax=Leptospira inadai serovar Lyme str. 10 TaxID=1049790 RepID=V6HTG0_9LEPT|nr:hypothetical protein LEP1GSC047_0537 [Leptospira inadai serovar Lyme str. 10]
MINWCENGKMNVLEINYFSSNTIGGVPQFLGFITRNC